MPRTGSEWLRLVAIFVLAAGSGYVAASVLFTSANLIRLAGVGAEIAAGDAWRTILFDLRGMAPSPITLSYGSVIFIGLAVAFVVAAWLRSAASRTASAGRRLAPWVFPVCGAIAIAVALLAMYPKYEVWLIAGARGTLGFTAQCLSGALAGVVFQGLYFRRKK